MKGKMTLSKLAKTWIFDLDGTIVKHNGYILDGQDTLLEGVPEYLSSIPDTDRIIILTSRIEQYKEQTLRFLEEKNIRYDTILFDMPFGERILINDRKPSGLDMAVAVNLDRDKFDIPAVIREK